WTETMVSFSSRPSRVRRCSTAFRMVGVIVRCLPVSSRRMTLMSDRRGRPSACPIDLVQDLALVRCRDLQLFAVLGNRPARELESLALQDVDDLRVAEQIGRAHV